MKTAHLSSKQKRFEGTCNYCKKKGHKEIECRKKKKDKGKNTPSVSATIVDTSSNAIVASFYGTSESKAWMLDSGCTKHMTPHRNEFTTYQSISPMPILLGDFNQSINYVGVGTVIGLTTVNGKAQKIELKNVLHAPDLPCRYFSVTTVLSKGFHVIFAAKDARITHGDQTLGVGFRKGDHFWLKIETTPSLDAKQPALPIDIWHQRLGHLNWNAISKVQGPQIINRRPTDLNIPCEGCLQGKQHRRPFPTSTTPRSSQILERIHSDLDGPMQTQSVSEKAIYFCTFIDDYTRYAWVYFLKAKSQQMEAFQDFKALVEKQHSASIKILRTDRGGEYESKDFSKFLRDSGIVHERTIADTPQQNGLAE